MNHRQVIPQTVDLTNCDKEPIHIPGSIQPHGALLALKEVRKLNGFDRVMIYQFDENWNGSVIAEDIAFLE